MHILHFNEKGARVDTIENLCIYKDMIRDSLLWQIYNISQQNF